MSVFRLLGLAILVVFGLVTTSVAAQPVMDHGKPMAYSDKAFLSGMIAHHEGAVEMAKNVLKTPEKDLNPAVVKWAKAIVEDQTKEIVLMQDMLKTFGGLDEAAYKTMQQAMHSMNQLMGGLGDPNMAFVVLMVPHHAQAIDMSAPALVASDSEQLLDLARDIIVTQAAEIRDFRNLQMAMDKNPAPAAKAEPAKK